MNFIPYEFDDYCKNLEQKYSEVGNATWSRNDFDLAKIQNSRFFFTDKSLESRFPVTKSLEVLALLSGLPFEKAFRYDLLQVQEELQKILGNTLVYWVKPQNLAVEHCVFKWPTDNWDDRKQKLVHEEIINIQYSSFDFYINGIQINPDGCVIAKGFDENMTIIKTREKLGRKLDFMPTKQSNWAHVPLGRILENVDKEKFSMLRQFIEINSTRRIAETHIDSLKFIHEKQWYMEKRSSLLDFKLNS
jgi:hypothetical protein